jgi:hypothetical protein
MKFFSCMLKNFMYFFFWPIYWPAKLYYDLKYKQQRIAVINALFWLAFIGFGPVFLFGCIENDEKTIVMYSTLILLRTFYFAYRGAVNEYLFYGGITSKKHLANPLAQDDSYLNDLQELFPNTKRSDLADEFQNVMRNNHKLSATCEDIVHDRDFFKLRFFDKIPEATVQ